MIGCFGSVDGTWFWGLSDRVSPQEHEERAVWTIERLAVPITERQTAVTDIAARIVAHMRAGDRVQAQIEWTNAFFRRLRPAFNATPELIEHLGWYHAYVLPSHPILYASPYHAFRFNAAKAYLVGVFTSAAVDAAHHAFAVTDAWVACVSRAFKQGFEDELRAAEAAGGYPILRIFDNTVTEVFRLPRVATDLSLTLSPGLRVGDTLIVDIAHQPVREHRFLTCCAQTYVCELTREIVDLAFDRRYTIRPARAEPPEDTRVLPRAFAAAMAPGIWPEDAPAAPAAPDAPAAPVAPTAVATDAVAVTVAASGAAAMPEPAAPLPVEEAPAEPAPVPKDE